ncbi:MAG: hypothetical protein IKJ34_03960, partial [Mailhella sp.]|nr:hypothetical protein [Mailhella sp.]
MSVSDYHIDADLNTTISGINIAEGCPPSGINNAIRQLMADVKTEKDARDQAQTAKDAAQDKAISDEAAARKKAVAALDESIDDEVAARESAVSALDAAVVHKSGAETIAGAKTFTGNVTVPTTPAGSTGNQVITADYLDSTGTYSPTSLPFIDLPETSENPYENNMDKVRTPGRYHVRWDSTTSGAPIAGLADAIVEVVRVGSAGSISSYARLLQVVYVVGKSDNANRVFWRRTKPEYGGPFADWVEVALNSFDGNLVFTNTGSTNAYVNIKNNAVTVEALPSSTRLTGIKMLDATGTAIGQCRTSVAKDGTTNTSVIAYSPDGTKNGSIAINYTAAGKFVGTSPTPDATSNTT